MTDMEDVAINTFLFCWSIISTIFGIIFLCWDIWQVATARKEKELRKFQLDIHKSQVKVWQHHAAGLMHGLLALIQHQYSDVKDVQEAVKISQASAFSLYASLNEERLFSEEEIKAKQLRNEQLWAAKSSGIATDPVASSNPNVVS